ncbi:IS701 family transposase [Streptomyces aurantiogriseus]|uniref:ISXo8 transposase n=1 Tax=Streptomyces aurantiogriseus TaxID=66870 RepID=A0A918C2F7_9ACTN|nr:transposase [Streptomyces aurantiogriseus]GGR02517.1 putative ISXo8 transposase [Streptomyces aurantiogriseus]
MNAPTRATPPPCDAATADLLTGLSDELFASLRRRDQRLRGEQYIRGLLVARGRKSVRNIAAAVGHPESEQNLHHFIADSTWDWRPIRAALARHLQRTAPPAAWVVEPLPIPKAGRHSVGVARQRHPQLGHVFRGQEAFGLWYASPRLSVPVNWRLLLPDAWARDAERRHRVSVPEEIRPETRDECAAAVVLEAVRHWDVPVRPVVIDGRGPGMDAVRHRLSTARIPVLARVNPATRLRVADTALPGFGAGPLPAERIMQAVLGLRRSVPHPSAPGPGPHPVLATAVLVEAPARLGALLPRPRGSRQLRLLGEWHDPQRPPARLWLTDVPDVSVPQLLRTTALAGRVAADLAEAGGPVGLRDYSGRSFDGWHRHITLASVAHAVALLAGRGPDRELATTARPGPPI